MGRIIREFVIMFGYWIVVLAVVGIIAKNG